MTTLQGASVRLRAATPADISELARIRLTPEVGFRPVGIMRQAERGNDGTWHDSLLMELLADELVEKALPLSPLPCRPADR
jgi:L-amino acid N-acyltransferase YncA